jgi:Mg2+ and Co2+ transporter CorA
MRNFTNKEDNLFHPYRREIIEAKSRLRKANDEKNYFAVRKEVNNLYFLYSSTSKSYAHLILDLGKTLEKIEKKEINSETKPMLERLVEDVKKMNEEANERLREITAIKEEYADLDAQKREKINQTPSKN